TTGALGTEGTPLKNLTIFATKVDIQDIQVSRDKLGIKNAPKADGEIVIALSPDKGLRDANGNLKDPGPTAATDGVLTGKGQVHGTTFFANLGRITFTAASSRIDVTNQSGMILGGNQGGIISFGSINGQTGSVGSGFLITLAGSGTFSLFGSNATGADFASL